MATSFPLVIGEDFEELFPQFSKNPRGNEVAKLALTWVAHGESENHPRSLRFGEYLSPTVFFLELSPTV